ncbi:hypothetical protein TWF696_008878 [Orbilia brochopaga]|uniref:F-box domain-containing protein n=1 Tax=Orbilia brochopaga TaxID=3140254 RepID=A0AAV9UEG5_9PEZI
MPPTKRDRRFKPVWSRTGPDYRLRKLSHIAYAHSIAKSTPRPRCSTASHPQTQATAKLKAPTTITMTGRRQKCNQQIHTGTSIASLPPELHIEILSYLHWKSHITCMQVCTLWRSILSFDNFSDKRYEGNGCSPRYSFLPGQLAFTITDGEITSVRPRIVPLDEHRYPVRDTEDAAFTTDPSSMLVSDVINGSHNISSSNSIELVDSPLLDEGYFRYYNCPPPEQVTWNKAIRGFFIGWVCWRDPVTGRIIKEDGGQSYFGARGDQDPDPRDMTVRGFLEFCRDIVVRKELLRARRQMTVEVCHLMGPSVGFLFYVLEVKDVN